MENVIQVVLFYVQKQNVDMVRPFHTPNSDFPSDSYAELLKMHQS